MSNNFTKVSTSLLPLEDIACYVENSLELVSNREDAPYPKANDTKAVSGIDANKIAVAIGEGELRNTVANALSLGGKPAEEYMSIEVGGNLSTASELIKKTYSDEISDLRDELYQLKSELAKKGVVENTPTYLGYTDMFRKGKFSNEHELLGTNARDSVNKNELIVTESVYEELDEGDYVALFFKDADRFNVRQIQTKMPDGETLILESSVDSICSCLAGNVEIYKSCGIISNGKYLFSRDANVTIGDKEMYTCLNDDTYRVRKQIKSEGTGYGYGFRIPEQKRGFLTTFEIQAKAYGNPGAMICYIIDERDVAAFKNPDQAREAYENGELKFFAKSNPTVHGAEYGERVVYFDFWNGNEYPLISERDDVDHKVRYVAIIEAFEVDEDNYYDIVFLQNKRSDNTLGDLQLNNTTYSYEVKESSSTAKALTTNDTVNAYDLYYGITTREAKENSFEPLSEALYSANIKCSYKEGVSRARLTMRINRECRYAANINNGAVYGIATNQSIPVINETSYLTQAPNLNLKQDITKPIELRDNANDRTYQIQTVIGNNIVKATGATVDQVDIDTPVYIYPGDNLYRIGYIVAIKAKRYEWNEEHLRYEVEDTRKVYLPLKAVIRDVNRKDNNSSDRLIFEADMTDAEGLINNYNEFELQIYWENKNLSALDAIKQEQVGAIHDLVLSFDRHI